jgi:hypothetical protein
LVDGVNVGQEVSVEMADGRTMIGVVRRNEDDGIGLEFDEPINDPTFLIGQGFDTEAEADKEAA